MATDTAAAPNPLSATALFSLLVHGVLLLGITFHFANPGVQPPTLDVTLVNVANRETPEHADFLAQASNRGGGDSDHAARPSQLFSGALPRPDPGILPHPVRASAPPAQEATPSHQVTSTGESTFQVRSDNAQARHRAEAAPPATELQREAAIAQLAAEVRAQNEALAKRPVKKFISASTREYVYANYMRAWSDRVQRVGNLNYPERARQNKLYGDLLLTVGINRDGSIHSITVIKSSGHAILDEAAERIVRLAGPFPPLPASAKVDELYITRTWEFLPGDVLRNK
ncbi:MAG: energy transducer TonB [Xanthomonadales bacterium]|nr:energy transducer TonB [Xanthomonadales bacterium]